MSKYLFVLAFFMIIVGIPVILGVGGDMFKRWLKHKEKMAEALNHETAEKAAQYAAHTERLEQRVRVLERIVTDKGLAVSDEIERLRDRPAPPALN
jgi:ABC-type Fe3+-hydroxamate transport system substrate-binding protein